MDKYILIKFMHSCGFDWIHDIGMINGQELVATKKNDGSGYWWRPIEVEGSGFTKLFKGSIKRSLSDEIRKDHTLMSSF